MANGFTQRHGINYQKTFALTAYTQIACILLVVAATKDLQIVPCRIKIAYLYATLLEEIYMEFPQGYERKIYCHFPRSCGMFYHLFRSTQSTCKWNQMFSHFLKQYDLRSLGLCISYSIISQNGSGSQILSFRSSEVQSSDYKTHTKFCLNKVTFTLSEVNTNLSKYSSTEYQLEASHLKATTFSRYSTLIASCSMHLWPSSSSEKRNAMQH